MKKLILSTMLALMALYASAAIGDTFSVDLLNYSIYDEGSSEELPQVTVTGLTALGLETANLKLDIPGNVTYNGITYRVSIIEPYAFAAKPNIKQVVLGYGITHIGAEAFRSCNQLEKLKIPSSIQLIGSNTFYGCSALKWVYINNPDPDSFTTSSSAFPNNEDIYLYVGKTGGMGGVSKYRSSSSYSMFSSVSLSYDSQDFNYGDLSLCVTKAPSKKSLGEVSIVNVSGSFTGSYKPVGLVHDNAYFYIVTSVSPYAFSNRTNVCVFDFSDAPLITSIGEHAFYGTGVTKIELPSSITKIGDYAFANATNLKELMIHTDGSMPSLGDSFYGGNNADFKCYVNYKQYTSYKNAISQWSQVDTEVPIDRLNAYFKSDNSAEAICIGHPVDWDASGVEAYTVNQVSVSEQIAYTQKQSATPAGTGLLVKGYSKGDIYKLVRPADTPTIGNNLLVGVTSAILTNVKNVSVGYYFDLPTHTFIRPTSDVYAAAGSAYLKLSNLLRYPSSLTVSGFEVDPEPTITGDVNGDGVVNVSDITALVNRILGDTTYSDSVCDVNADGDVNVSDVTTLVNIILNGGSNPSTPNENVFTVNGVSFAMIPVEGGTFTMGATSEQISQANEDELPTHQVTLSSYMIGKTEVTQELWQAVMGSNPSDHVGENLPVEYMLWDDCQEFITKLNALTGKTFRLPTEAEWEYAARGGNKSQGYKYSGSNTDSIGDVAWYADNSNKTTHPVATKAPNELGIYDMSGNVEEYCSDWFGSYSSSSQTNPSGPDTGLWKVVRGGSYQAPTRCLRVSYRGWQPMTTGSVTCGLRLVLSE